MKYLRYTSSLLLATFLITPSFAAEQAAGKDGEELFKFHGCINCHGAHGKNPVSKTVPSLAGKPAKELQEKATKILSGESESEESKIMHAAFYSPTQCDAGPTDEQLASITAWLSAQ